MKTLVIFSFLLASFLASAKVIHPVEDATRASNVNNDIQEIIDVIPRNEVENIVKKWIGKDQEVASNWAYATSEGMHNTAYEIESLPEFMVVRQQLESVNVDVRRWANEIHKIIGAEPMTKSVEPSYYAANTGLRGCLDEIRPKISTTKIVLKVTKKYLFSSQFRKLVNLTKSAAFKKNVEKLLVHPRITAAVKDAQANGVDMKAIYDFLRSLSPIYYDLLELENEMF